MPEDVDPEIPDPTDPQDPEEKETPDPVDPPEGKKSEKTFTQEDLNRALAKDKRKAKTEAASDILKQLGVEDLDSAKAVLDEVNQRKEAEKSEAQREKEAAERARKAADDEREAAKAERETLAVDRQLLKVERLLVAAELPAKHLEDASALVSRKLDAESTDEDIAVEIEAFKERMAELFVTTPAPNPGTPNSHVQGKPPAQKTGDDPFAIGAQIAARRQGRDKQAS